MRLLHILASAALLAALAACAIRNNSAAVAGSTRADCGDNVMPGQAQDASTVRRLDLTWGKRWTAGDVAFLDCLYSPMWH
jgi:hypothetical protein